MPYIAEGLAQWLRSLPPNPEVPGSIPGLVEGWIFGWSSFPLKFTQLSILPGSVKWVPAYMDRFEAAARGAYICFRSAGGKLIIVKRLWACYMEKALYKCTTLKQTLQETVLKNLLSSKSHGSYKIRTVLESETKNMCQWTAETHPWMITSVSPIIRWPRL